MFCFRRFRLGGFAGLAFCALAFEFCFDRGGCGRGCNAMVEIQLGVRSGVTLAAPARWVCPDWGPPPSSWGEMVAFGAAKYLRSFEAVICWRH